MENRERHRFHPYASYQSKKNNKKTTTQYGHNYLCGVLDKLMKHSSILTSSELFQLRNIYSRVV